MEPEVVYEAHCENVDRILQVLWKAGLHAERLDAPSGAMVYATAGQYVIRIAVPAVEAGTARRILRRMEAASHPGVERLDRRVKAGFAVFAVAAATGFGVACHVLGDAGQGAALWGLLCGVTCTILWGQRGKLVALWRRP